MTFYYPSNQAFIYGANYVYTHIPSAWTIFNAMFVTLGLWMIAKYYTMVKYQFKYGDNYGIRYLRGEISKEEKKNLEKNFSWFRRLKG